MIVGGTSVYGIGWDMLVLLVSMIALIIIGAKLYPKVIV